MEIKKQRKLIESVASEWEIRYYNRRTCLWDTYDRLTETKKDSKEDIYNKLAELNLTTASASDIDAIIGNASWTHYFCDCCSEYVSDVVEGWEDGEGCMVQICFDCINKMHDLIKDE